MNCARSHVVVTGASSGIGRATALHLAARGHHVYAGVRDLKDGISLRHAARGEVTPLTLDVTDAGQIQAAVLVVSGHVGNAGLAGLVGNAGIGMFWPLELIPLNQLRRQFEVNVIGQVAVTQAFLPLLRQAKGRIVMIGSIGDRITMPFVGPLAASKSAIATMAGAFRLELAPWGIRVVLIEPATIRTDAAGKVERDANKALSAFSAPERALYEDPYRKVIRAGVARERGGSPPNVVAHAVGRALTARNPRARYLVGKDSRRLAAAAALLPARPLDALRRRIFGLPAPGSAAVPTPGPGAVPPP